MELGAWAADKNGAAAGGRQAGQTGAFVLALKVAQLRGQAACCVAGRPHPAGIRCSSAEAHGQVMAAAPSCRRLRLAAMSQPVPWTTRCLRGTCLHLWALTAPSKAARSSRAARILLPRKAVLVPACLPACARARDREQVVQTNAGGMRLVLRRARGNALAGPRVRRLRQHSVLHRPPRHVKMAYIGWAAIHHRTVQLDLDTCKR